MWPCYTEILLNLVRGPSTQWPQLLCWSITEWTVSKFKQHLPNQISWACKKKKEKGFLFLYLFKFFLLLIISSFWKVLASLWIFVWILSRGPSMEWCPLYCVTGTVNGLFDFIFGLLSLLVVITIKRGQKLSIRPCIFHTTDLTQGLEPIPQFGGHPEWVCQPIEEVGFKSQNLEVVK